MAKTEAKRYVNINYGSVKTTRNVMLLCTMHALFAVLHKKNTCGLLLFTDRTCKTYIGRYVIFTIITTQKTVLLLTCHVKGNNSFSFSSRYIVSFVTTIDPVS